jgi:hypothetical protein
MVLDKEGQLTKAEVPYPAFFLTLFYNASAIGPADDLEKKDGVDEFLFLMVPRGRRSWR